MINMRNSEVVKILKEIALFLEMNDVQFKPRAYEKAANSIEALEDDIQEVYKRGGTKALMEIPSIGKNIAEKIKELMETGKLEYYEKLKREIPVDLESLSRVKGLGPKTIRTLWQKLKIKDINDLEKAALAHKISALSGFQERTEQNILKGIELARKGEGRHILGFTLPLIREIENRLRTLPEVKRALAAGSVRRMKETIGDADFLIISDNPEKVMDFFVSMPEVADIMVKGETKTSVRFRTGLDADIRVLKEESFGAALQYFTGSKDHNIALRRIAQDRNWKLSEYGLFQGDSQIAGKTEEEVYHKLGLQWVPPELRENTGEIKAAANSRLPELIGYKDLKGDLQVHTNWTDGSNSIKEMAEEAKKFGLEYIVISDHSKSLAIAGGLDERMLLEQAKEIEEANEKVTGLKILKGVELNILEDGSLDMSDKVLETLDVVGAAVHSHFNLDKKEMTERVLKAIENPNVDILYHPTARQIQRREPIQLDIEKIVEAAKDNGTILDIDSYPDRLDLKDEYIRKAVEMGTKLGISSDSHNKFQIRFLELGVAQGRRGWATAKDIVNTREVQGLLSALKS